MNREVSPLMSDKTTVIENRHFYAKCWECRYTGPLRYRRDLAQSDADRHRAAEHPEHDPGVAVDERVEP